MYLQLSKNQLSYLKSDNRKLACALGDANTGSLGAVKTPDYRIRVGADTKSMVAGEGCE